MDPEKTLGRYKVTATLGEGEMGTVYLAEDPAIGRKLAIKTMRRPARDAGQEEEDARARFDREVRVTGTFSHPNIVTVYDVGIEEEEAFVAMAYVDGGSLSSLLASTEGTLPFPRVVELVSQVASGLDYAHKNDVVHRDVKPANILLTSEGAPMVSDFGVARMSDSKLTRQGEACGSPSYMSPEQAAAQEVTGASDQFSLAIITYEMLTGELPFAGRSITTVMYQIVHNDAVPPERINPLVPPAVSEVVMRAMSKHPGGRYPSCTAYAEALAQAFDAPVAAPGKAPVNSGEVAASTPAQLAATVQTEVSPPRQGGNVFAEAMSRLQVMSRLEAMSRLKDVPPLVLGAVLFVLLATGMWLGIRRASMSAPGEADSSQAVTESATGAVPPGVLPGSTSPSESPDAGMESNAASPTAIGETPDPDASDPVPATAEPDTSDPAPATAEPDTSGPAPATAEPAAADPPPATIEPEAPDPAPATVEREDPEVVAAAAESSDEVAPPDTRWTIVAAGRIPEKFGERALNAATVMEEIGNTPEQGIPAALLGRAACVAVIPNVRKVGFIIGTTYGRGVVSCRTEGGWSRPSFLSIGGGGLQVGAQSTDFVLVFVDPAAAEQLVAEKFELGTDAPVAAGPVGQEAETDPEATPQAEIFAYSRSDGSFEGATLEGTDVEIDHDANDDVYGRAVGPRELLRDDIGELPDELAAFLRILTTLAGG